jgi:thiamine-monophosphate kinase
VSEFDLINHFFKTAKVNRDDVLLGIGDDCAILSPPSGKALAVSTDTLISGVHFPESTCAQDVGYKSLAVNLSDLAAMGADPAWVSLAISLPEVNEAWLEKFMLGFNELATEHNVKLIGGDTTQGSLSITINVSGFIDPHRALKRSRAKPGDLIFVTGDIGDAGIGLYAILNDLISNQYIDFCMTRLNRPRPQVKAGKLLSDFRVAAIDISDGLLVDLQHICRASGTGAVINLDKIPVSDSLLQYYNNKPDWQAILNAGDDYELCFTCPENECDALFSVMTAEKIDITCIGNITDTGITQCLQNDKVVGIKPKGYNHF